MSEIDQQSADAALAIRALTSLSSVTSTPPHNSKPPPTPTSSSAFTNDSLSYVPISHSYHSIRSSGDTSISPSPLQPNLSNADASSRLPNHGLLVNNTSISSPPPSSPVSKSSVPSSSSFSYTTQTNSAASLETASPLLHDSENTEKPPYPKSSSTPPHVSSSSPPSTSNPAKTKSGNARKKTSSRKSVTFNESSPGGAPNDVNSLEPEIYSIDAGVIRCICGYVEDDGFTIQCEKCNAWQHAVCVNIENDKVPEIYLCDRCGTLTYDVEAARRYQENRLRSLNLQPTIMKDMEEDDLASKSKRSKGAGEKKRNSTDQLENVPEPPETAEDGHPVQKRRKSREDEKENKRNNTSERGSSAGASPKVSSSRSSPAPSNNGTNNMPAPTTTNTTPGTRRGRTKRLTVANGLPSSTKDDVNDNDNEPEKKFTLAQMYSSYFVPILQNRYSTPKIHQYVDNLASNDELENDKPTHLTAQEYEYIKPPEVTVKLTSDHPKQKFSGFSRFGLFLEQSVPRERFIINYVGQVMTKEEYKRNPINQYRQFGCPKPGVMFHSTLPICIDARLVGSPARFMRRSCRPNCKVSTVIIDDRDVNFVAFSTEPINAGSELTVAWEWDALHPVRKLIDGIPPEKLSKEERLFLVQVASMTNQRGADCACNLPSGECLLARMKRANGTPPRNTRIGSKTRRGIADSAVASSASLDSGAEGDNGCGVYGTEASDSAAFYSSREARKLQSAMELIEKLSRKEESRKRKRDSTDELEDQDGLPIDSSLSSDISQTATTLGKPKEISDSLKISQKFPTRVDKAIQTVPITVSLRQNGDSKEFKEKENVLELDSRPLSLSARMQPRKRMLNQYLQAKQAYNESRSKTTEPPFSNGSYDAISLQISTSSPLPTKRAPIVPPTRVSSGGKSTLPSINGSATSNSGTSSTTPNVSVPSSPHLPHNDYFPVNRVPSKPPTPVPGSPLTTPVSTPTSTFDSAPLSQLSTATTILSSIPDTKPTPIVPVVPSNPVTTSAKPMKKLSFADYKKKKTTTVSAVTTSQRQK